MSFSNARPKWWQLYLAFPLLIALFMLEHRLKLSVRGHQAVQIGILVIVFGLIHLWLKANAKALSRMDQMQFYRTVTVTRIPPHQPPDPKREKQPMFQLPDLEIKGTLSDAFEMDYIDAEFIAIGEAAKDLKKE